MKVFSFAGGQVVESEEQITLEQARAEKQAEADAIAFSILESAVAKHPALEKSTWTQKRAQAEAFLASGNQADCPALALEAMATVSILAEGDPSQESFEQELSDLANSIVTQAQVIEGLQAQVIGWRSAMSKVLANLPTVSAVQDFPIQAPI